MSGLRIAACPLLFRGDDLYVVLVTGRRRGDLLLPKGRPERGMSYREVAQMEAWEEAGIIGEADGDPECFTIPRGAGPERTVIAFPMHVGDLLDRWPEMEERRRILVPVGRLHRIDLAGPWLQCIRRLCRRGALALHR